MHFHSHSRPVIALLASLVLAPAGRLFADTTLTSGTTTISTGTDFGANLFVGVTGTATLEVVAGGSASNGAATLGSVSSGVGTAVVTGGTWTTLGDLDVVNGALTMSGGLVAVGGRLQNTATGTITVLPGGTLQIGVGGTTGELANFDWLVNDGTLVFNRSDASTYAGNFYGNGRLIKEGAGSLTVSGLVACWGGATIHSGTLALPWNSNLQNNANTNPIVIGDSSGDAGFVQMSGGALWGLAVSLGKTAGSAGTATVSSGNFVGDELIVGDSGTGTINVTGGSLSSQSCVIGAQAGGMGTVTVSGGQWNSYNGLVVGGSGTGTLTLTGGILTVLGTLSHGASGTINLVSGGTLSIGDGNVFVPRGELAVPALTNNGTLIFNRADAASYAGVISGSGAVTKQGEGTLSLAAINFYSGGTTISAGKLALTGTASIGTGGLNLGTTASRGTFDISAILSGSYALPSTGDLVGSGTITGSGKTLAVEGSFGPGNSPGTVTLDAGLTLDLASSIASTFEFTDPAFTAGTFDLVDGDGSVIYGGLLNLSFSGGSYANGTDVAHIFSNAGSRFGSFTAVNSTGLAPGQSATFNPSTGSITIVPEPVVAHVTVVAGLIATAWARRRRHPSKAPTRGA